MDRSIVVSLNPTPSSDGRGITASDDMATDVYWWRACATVLAAALVACIFYAVDRSRAAIVHGPPDPLSITASTRIEYFWRIGLGAFLGGSTALGVWLYPPGDPKALTLSLARWTVPVTIGCAIASFIWP
jgi:hypothetical protein